MRISYFPWAWALLAMLISTLATGLVLPSSLEINYNMSAIAQPLNISQYSSSNTSQPIKAPAATRYSWFMDRSCTARPGFMAAFQEARDMACLAAQKIASNTDYDFERVFRDTFHAPKDSAELYDHSQFWRRRHRRTTKRTPWQHVDYVLGGICRDWSETNDFRTAVLRIHCDSGRQANIPIETNHGISTGEQQYADINNGIYLPLRCTENLGAGQADRNVFAYHGGNGLMGYDDQPKDRSLMIICDRSLNRPGWNHVPTLDDLRFLDLQKIVLDDMWATLSVTILHEWTHSHPYHTSDVPNRHWPWGEIAGSAYGWRNNMIKRPPESLINADTYAMLGLWAKLANAQRLDFESSPPYVMRGGFTLARDPGPWFPSAQTEANQQRFDGKLMCYADITH